MSNKHWVERPLYSFVVIVVSVFILELLLMFILMSLPYQLQPLSESLLDASILSLVIAPVLWFVILLPIKRLFEKRSLALKSALTEAKQLVEILEKTPDFVGLANAKGLSEYVNPAGCRMMGFESQEDVINLPVSQYHPSGVIAFLKAVVFPVAEKNGAWEGELPFLSRDGRQFITSAILVSHKDEKNVVQRYSIIARDITLEKQNTALLEIDSLVFEMAKEAVMITDSENRIINVNRAFSETTGYSKSEVLGDRPSRLSSGEQGKDFYESMWKQLSEQGSWQGEITNRRKNGDHYPEWLSIVVVRDSDGQVKNHIAVFSDITERKHAEAMIKHQALYDSLTNLPNRRLFEDRLEQAIHRSERNAQQFAVLFMDLDLFKRANDEYGHLIGDQLLQEVAARLRSSLRQSDTAARFGGDEFAVILNDIQTVHSAEVSARNIITSISNPYLIGKNKIVIGVSIGISLFPDCGESPVELIKAADDAMYQVKKTDRGSFQLCARIKSS